MHQQLEDEIPEELSIVENILDNPEWVRRLSVSSMFDYNASWSVPTRDSEGKLTVYSRFA